jgi:hypothetical protein
MKAFKIGIFVLFLCFIFGEVPFTHGKSHNATRATLSAAHVFNKEFSQPLTPSIGDYDDELIDDDDSFESVTRAAALIGPVILLFLLFNRELAQLASGIRTSFFLKRLRNSPGFLCVFRI